MNESILVAEVIQLNNLSFTFVSLNLSPNCDN